MEARSTALLQREVRARRPVRWWIALVIVLTAVCVLAFQWWLDSRRRRAIQQLPPKAQQAMFQSTYQSARSACAGGSGLESECAHQARLLLDFPQCDAGCRAFAQRFVGGATR